jgi:hypothetical protein
LKYWKKREKAYFYKMRKSQKELRSQIDQDYLIDRIREKLLTLVDPRNRWIDYSFHDLVMSAYAMFHLKYPSLNRFATQTSSEKSNLKELFKIENLCSDSQLRNILDQLNPDCLRDLYGENFELLRKIGVLKEYQSIKNHLICSIDGVQHFSSKTVHCDECLTKNHSNGTVTYHHNMLCAALVHPTQREVFIMGSEPIIKQDGQTKNDCELNAGTRILKWLSDSYKDYKLLIVEDALYANGPHLRQILENNWQFVVNIKPKSQKILFKAFEMRKERGAVKYSESIDEEGTIHRFWFANNFALNETSSDVRVNVLFYEEQKKNGKIQKFSWATSIKLSKSNIERIMRIGRSRWKIENQTFNTLKNQGYEFDHNFGHGFKYLTTCFAYLMLLAFQNDQLFQRCNELFNKVWVAAKTKVKLWETIKAIFMTQIVFSFKEIYRMVANEFEVTMDSS